MKKNFKKVTTYAGLAIGTLVVVTSFQNCGVAGFEAISDSEKRSLIMKTNVFGSGHYVMANTSPDGMADAINTIVSVSNDNTGIDVPVKYYCSTNNYKNVPRVVDVDRLKVRLIQNQQVVCDDSTNQYGSIVDFKKFRVPYSCLNKVDQSKNFSVSLITDKGETLGVWQTNFNANANSKGAQEVYKFDGLNLQPPKSGSMFVIYDRNPQLTKSVTHNECDTKASPLVALIGQGSRSIELTAPSTGIEFDILGRRAAPQAHTKKRISWFLNANHNYYFIALPDNQGRVHGIDQLFGDNTFGPDGKYADNGYAALAKYDSNRDGYISSKDPIYQKLRLWHDSDLNGESSPDELFTLEEMNIVSIDLKFDSSYKEVDTYGNEILMKSAIKDGDGNLHLLFDLWFRNLN